MKTRLVIFDLDGTLVDSFRDIVAGIRVACAAVGAEATPALEKLATRGIPLEDFYSAAFGAEPAHDAEVERFARFVDAYRACYLPGCLTTTVPFPGVIDTLAALRARPDRPRLAVATTKRTETAGRVLEGTGLARFIDAYAGSDGIPHKPDPTVLRKVAGLCGEPAEGAVMVGDTDRDVGAARAAGARAFGVTWGGFTETEMRGLRPDAVLTSFPELLQILD